MDQEVLVEGGLALVTAMDREGVSPRMAVWVHNTDTDTWKLWLVPPNELTDKRDFYRRLAQIISAHRSELSGLEISDTEFVQADHPGVVGLGRFIRAPGLVTAHFTANRFNGYLLPEVILLRSNL